MADEGDVGPWRSTSSLNTARTGRGVAVFNGYIYAVAGHNENTLRSVEFARINANGTLGSWSPTSAITTERESHGVAAYNGFLYVVSGRIDSTFRLTVEAASINANGTLGLWTVLSSTLPTVQDNPGVVAYEGYLYAVGGTDENFVDLATVRVAKIEADGTLGSWTSTSSLSNPHNHLGVAAYGDHLYAIAGTGGTGENINDVEIASINADGTLGEWSISSSSPNINRGGTFLAQDRGFLYAAGGPRADPSVEMAKINSDGTLGVWTSASSLIQGRTTTGVVTYNGRIYAVAGLDDDGAPIYLNSVEVAGIDPLPIFSDGFESGDTSAWSATSP